MIPDEAVRAGAEALRGVAHGRWADNGPEDLTRFILKAALETGSIVTKEQNDEARDVLSAIYLALGGSQREHAFIDDEVKAVVAERDALRQAIREWAEADDVAFTDCSSMEEYQAKRQRLLTAEARLRDLAGTA